MTLRQKLGLGAAVFVAIGLIGSIAGGDGDGPTTTLSPSDSIAQEFEAIAENLDAPTTTQATETPATTTQVTAAPTTTFETFETFGVGEGDWQLSDEQILWIEAVRLVEPTDDFFAPEDGFKWVAFDVVIENHGSEAYSSGVFDFELRSVDGQEFEYALFAETGAGDVNGNILTAKELRGALVYEVPKDLTVAELYWSANVFVFDPVYWTLELPS